MSLQVVLLRRVRFLRTALLSILILFFLLSRITPAEATDFNPGCTAGVGDAAALQSAIATAGGNAQDDSINLVAGCTYTVSSTLIVNPDGKTVTINGNGATLSGNNTVRVILVNPSGRLNVNNVTITGGSAINGAGLYNSGYLTIAYSTLTGNATTGGGGAVYNFDSSLTIQNSTFTGNSAANGGALYNDTGIVVIFDSTFTGNTATTSGGAIRSANSGGALTIQRSTFNGNTSSSTGGALYNSAADLFVRNSTFTSNTAVFGGGLYIFSGASTLLNSTISGNTATNTGGGVLVSIGAPTLSSTLVAANTAPTSPDYKGSMTSSGYNLVGNSSGTVGLTVNDYADAAATPLNLDALANNGGKTQTMALLEGSVAIDHGSPTLSGMDFEQRGIGYPRVVNSVVDIGAYEVQPPCPSFPASIANGDSAGLITAIHCANRTTANEVINLASSGSYTLTNALISIDGSSRTGLPAAMPATDSGALTINGNGSTIARYPFAPEMRILEVAGGGNLTLNSVTLTEGLLTVSGAAYGGGIYNDGTLAINSSTLIGNIANNGAGIFNSGALTISSSSITSNYALVEGGGIDNYSSGVLTISGSTLASNEASNAGQGKGGAVANHGTATVNSSAIYGNSSASDGGGFYNTETLTISNSTIANNNALPTAFTVGGGIYNNNLASLTVRNSTISGNRAQYAGGGIYGSVSLGNTIVALNHTNSQPQVDVYGAVTSLGYNLIGSSTGASGLLGTDLFDGAATPLNLGALANNGGLTQTIALLAGSVAIDHGDPAFVPPPDYDQRGVGFPRVRVGRLDIGAYEAPGPSSLTLQLTLQGRPAAPNPAYVTTVHLLLRPAGGGSPLPIADGTSNASGQVSIPDLPVGNYILRVKGTHTLAVTQSITLVAGANNATTPVLKEGDADDLNTVTITDFAILAAAFGKTSGMPGYDGRADFNGDNAVTIADFSLLALNFGQAGAS